MPGLTKGKKKVNGIMMTWTSDEPNKIGIAEKLQLASLPGDGTYQSPVTIWVVRVVDDLYVRAHKGRTNPCFRDTHECCQGYIWAGGIDKDVTFMGEPNPDINDRIDVAYHTKHRHQDAKYFDPMVVPDAQSATIGLVLRSIGS